jgi:hypothetical protein
LGVPVFEGHEREWSLHAKSISSFPAHPKNSLHSVKPALVPAADETWESQKRRTETFKVGAGLIGTRTFQVWRDEIEDVLVRSSLYNRCPND